MATYTKIVLTGSTDGAPIPITDSATPGQTVHTAHATAEDEIYLWACNTHATDAAEVTIEMDISASAANKFTYFNIPANGGLIPVSPGLILTNSKLCTVFADATAKIVITGWVIRYTP